MKRSELPDAVFGIPQERKYPMPDEKHTRSAIKLFNYVEPKYEEQLAEAILKNMKKYNIDKSVVGEKNRLRKYIPNVVTEAIISGIDTLVFDIGDVLVGSKFRELVYDHVPEEFAEELIQCWCIHSGYTEECSLGEYLDLIASKLRPDLHKYIPDMLYCATNSIYIQPYTYNMIIDLKEAGYSVYYLSNWSKWSRDYYISNGMFRFIKLMDGGIFSCDVECMKPDSRIYKRFFDNASNAGRLDPTRCIFFDDKPKNIKASIASGMEGKVFVAGETNLWIYETFLKGKSSLFDQNTITEGLGSIKKKVLGTKVDPKITPSKAYEIGKKQAQYVLNSNPSLSTEVILLRRIESQRRTNWDNYNNYKMELGIFKIKGFDEKHLEAAKDCIAMILEKGNNTLKPLGYTMGIDADTSFKNGVIYIRKGATIREGAVSEYGTTAGTIVGPEDNSNDVCIVNYMAKNSFTGEKESRFGICRKGMKDLHIFSGKDRHPHYVSSLEDFLEKVQDIKIYRYTGTKKNGMYSIIEDADKDLDFYNMLVGSEIDDRDLIAFNPAFEEIPNFTDELNAISECTTAGILSVCQKIPAIPVFTEYVQSRPYNFFRDVNGIFIQHELTGVRSKSYNTIQDIPDAQMNIVKRGYII